MKLMARNLVALTMGVALSGCLSATSDSAKQVEAQPKSYRGDVTIWPQIQSEVATDTEIEAKVSHLVKQMTLAQKVAQMIQPEIRDITVEDMRKYGFGSYLNGGGAFPNNNKHSTPADWIDLAEQMYQASIDDSLDGISIPTMWGTDAVHGHNNVIGATLFPHNIGLGAANNPALIEKIAEITATEVMVTGIDWVFAPTVATVRDDRWGRTYEGYSEDPEIVKAYANAIVKGLQGDAKQDFLGNKRVISTVKHFIGDGGTVGGDDQGDNIASEQALFDLHAQGYVGGLTAGAQSVMASFNSWHGKKIHGSKYLLTDVLKDRMGFDGFVVGDWNGHGQIKGCSNANCPAAVNAGLDMYMVPTDAWKPLLENTIKQVEQGIIPVARIDDAVSRILRVKFRAGLFEKPSPANRKLSGKTALIGQQSHREVAQQAVRESLVLLKNKGQLLPLKPQRHFLIAGDGADNIGKQSGGWTITWQGTNNTNQDFPGGSSILDGFKTQVEQAGGSVEFNQQGEFEQRPDVAIVVYGEEPYAEGHGDRKNLVYQRGSKKDLALLKKLKADNIPVVSVFISGRPMWVNAELNASDAFIAAWLPGSEGKAIADVLLTDQQGSIQFDFTGKLSFSWPQFPDQIVNKGDKGYQPLLPYGFGLSYGDKNQLADNLDESTATLTNQQQTLPLYNGQAQAPWQLVLVDDNKSKTIQSNAAKLTNIEFRTVDRFVQEDAFKLTLAGGQKSGIELISHNGFREDLSSMLEANAALNFAIKRQSEFEKPVQVIISCEDQGDKAGSCVGSIDIADYLNVQAIDDWLDIAIDLQCFAKQQVKFSQITKPFVLTSAAKGSLALNNIQLGKPLADSKLIKCDD